MNSVNAVTAESVAAGMEVLPAQKSGSFQKQDLFSHFTRDILQPLAILSGMHLSALALDADNVFDEPAPEVCRAARLEGKTRIPCRRFHYDLREKVRASLQPQSSTCALGLHVFCLPVMTNGKLFGWIEGGRVFCDRKSPEDRLEPLKRVLRRSRWAALAQGLTDSYVATALLKNSEIDLWIRVLTALAADLAAKAAALDATGIETQHPGVLKAIAYLRQHLAEPLTPGLVARVASVSDHYFNKLFKRETGFHFSEYLARERICKACGLLLETGQNVGEIAFAVGFDSVPYFNRCFKALTKTTPRAYRLDRVTPSLANREQKEVPPPQNQPQAMNGTTC